MGNELLEFIFLGISFVLSGFYSGSEAILMSIPVDRTRQLIEAGGKKGRALSFVAEHSKEVLTTILIGNNLVNIFAASLTTQVTARHFESDALALSVGLTTLLILFFGEIIPKTFARVHAETLSLYAIRILKVNYILFYPVVMIFTWFIEKILGKNAELAGRIVTKADIEFMVSRAEKENSIDSKQIELLSSILEFPTIKVKDIMIPRNQVVSIPVGAPFDDLIQIFNTHNHSRYPVCDGELDETIGFLHVKDLFFLGGDIRKDFDIKRYLKKPFFVYEHMKIQAVFDHMNRKKVHLALIKDENGTVVGIVTLEDIVEEIFGEIMDEHDDEEKADGSGDLASVDGILVSGQISLRDLDSNYDIKIPLNDNYSTLAGFLLDRMGNNFPKKGMMLFWEGYSFQLEKVDNYEISLVKIHDVEGEKHLYLMKDQNKKN